MSPTSSRITRATFRRSSARSRRFPSTRSARGWPSRPTTSISSRPTPTWAIAVILSGGGTDGTLGFQAVKAEGGITIAQDEQTALHTSMPRSAVLEGNVDYILEPRDIARQLVRLVRHSYTQESHAPGPAITDLTSEILHLLRTIHEIDFTHYKPGTINRRIHRRMALRDCQKLEQYLRILRADRDELGKLYQDLLIHVTQFFRDPDAFKVLQEVVFPALTDGRPASEPIRIWVAGCSTGEEVYSIAIALLEFLEGRSHRWPIKILATDVNDTALDRARAGAYIDNIEIDVSTERLRRFFNRSGNHYHISKTVRDLCIFSRHDMTRDPPFSHLDLVSCRNVLIYMDGVLQRRLLPILHYSLNPGAYLFLGSSESLGTVTEFFSAVDGRHRIYQKRPAPASVPIPVDFSSIIPGVIGRLRAAHEETNIPWSAQDVQREADRIVMSRYAPVGVVIDEMMTVIQFRGRTAPYLEPAPGLASLELFRMLSEGLLAPIRVAVNQARDQNATVVCEALRSSGGAPEQKVRVTIIPFKLPPSGPRFFLLLFADVTEGAPPVSAPPEVRPTGEPQVPVLQQELAATREYLQSVVEEQESTNEELKAANEEILSANEELQSTNEELQTAKEEAQSANEELATVNEELRRRNAELARVNDDLVNLLSGVGIPIVIVSRDLRIRRFTPLAEKVFRLIPTDVGRPLSDIQTSLEVPNLSKLIAGVIDKLSPYEGEVKDTEGHTYSLRVRPYVTLDNVIDGASVVLIETDSLRVRSQRSEVRDQKSEVRSQEAGEGGQESGDGDQGRATGLP
jgi:two-component system CheB/CheR fusion protein